jgi:5-formyltetrahydrofolate cyclo-ligase
MREKKHQLRAEALLRREARPSSELRLWNQQIQARVIEFSHYLLSRSVALYSPIGNEIATDEIRDHALRTGKQLFYPKSTGRGDLNLVAVNGAEEMRSGLYGILEPTGNQALAEEDREGLIVFVPGVIFDLHGNRLGRGKGGYDRLLKFLGEAPRFAALAYEFQVVESLPAEEWDRKVHYIITERRIIDCGSIPSRSRWVC